jgi:heat shock protein HspQ
MINLSEGFAPLPDKAKFETGEIIKHIRYGYRGVIVDYDNTCQAPEHWYYSNQTQPDRNQPWYHVLVDGNQQVTYVAESNLAQDQTGKPVVHGMLNLFFSGYNEQDNKYQRNDVPWNPGNPPEAPPPSSPPDYTPPPNI